MGLDASAAIGMSNRAGLGKSDQLKLQGYEQVQEQARRMAIIVNKVSTDDNLSDALTKEVNAAGIQKHVEGAGTEIRTDRQRVARKSTTKSTARRTGPRRDDNPQQFGVQ